MPLHSKCRRSTRDRSIGKRVMTVRLDERRVPADSFVLFEDVDGKGHKSLHSPEEQTVLWISLPLGLENP